MPTTDRRKVSHECTNKIILPHKFYADFVVFDKIILEIKAVDGINENFVAQALNYLTVSKQKLALIVKKSSHSRSMNL
jgi:GxxExxY protein